MSEQGRMEEVIGGVESTGAQPVLIRAAGASWKPDASGGSYWELGLKDVSLTCFRLGAGVSFPPHAHAAEQITMVLEGRLTFEVGTSRHILGPGDAIAIPSGLEHAVICGEEEVLAIDAWSPPPEHLGSE